MAPAEGAPGAPHRMGPEKRLAELENVALEDNVTNWVLQRTKVVDAPVAFDELMGHTGR